MRSSMFPNSGALGEFGQWPIGTLIQNNTAVRNPALVFVASRFPILCLMYPSHALGFPRWPQLS